MNATITPSGVNAKAPKSKILIRSEVPLKDRWNVEALYPNMDAWQKAYDKIAREGKHPHWPEIATFQGRLGEGAAILKTALELILGLERTLSSLYTYAHLRHDEDITDDRNKTAFKKIQTLLLEFQQEISWFDPELLSLPDHTLESYLNSSELADYKFHLQRIIRLKPHTLSSESEELLAQAGKALQVSYKAFSAMSDADFKFGTLLDSKGQERELTHGLYGVYIRDQDRDFRKKVFAKYHNQYGKYANTLCELVGGQVNKSHFHAHARHYPSCLDAALFPHQIDPSVYHALIEAVNSRLSVHHKYVKLRKKLLGLDKLHLYDMYVPLTSHVDIQIPYEEAESLIIESVAPLGQEYQSYLRDGFQKNRWVDRYENQNKRSGGYSSGCYDSMPYILMNYKNILRDAFVLAHEAGHSMHSLLSRKNQAYHYADYPIFVAEVASTFNEELLMQLLLKRYTAKDERIFLINQKIEDIRGTLFRQTMFAEFELAIHEMGENNIPHTPALLNEKYHQLLIKYFGGDVVIDPEAMYEWARIPHFYYNFYVYQYATGISAALALVDKVTKGGEADRNAYLTFLKSGGSKYPIDLLKLAGVDMRSPEPVRAAIAKFDRLVDELDSLTK